ncbi:Oxidative stress survival, Svf1-like [Phaffia rhodozyma]|uniref:Oxidative stress survival, Svf1-like n=1 Tax=Phaffia rhodozyma TaxID=264483 RepID=A0A0F7SLX1_PHARH|nr:Oxidative stress survival, Svf1-like [Phaffia rhodozyma]
MSWLLSSSPAVSADTPNFKSPPTSGPLFGPLTEQDTTWACDTTKGFMTETQSWYAILADGSWCMFQIIWSITGIFLVPATVQFTFKHFDPKTKKAFWKSTNLTNFKPAGKGMKSDQVTITHTGTSSTEETYVINANLAANLQIMVTFVRPQEVPGFKIGEGAQGGMSYFGTDKNKPDGFAVHRFHPVQTSTGHIIIDKKAISTDGEATFIHAIQGMQPNKIARRWNFAFFTSNPGAEKRVRAIMMEFETNDEHGVNGKGTGRNKVNLGGIVYDNKLSLVTSQLHNPQPEDDKSSVTTSMATHMDLVQDSFTGYSPPSRVKFEWAGEALNNEGAVKAWVENETGSGEVGEKGLIEKVDVLAEIPYLIKKVVQVVASTKPYIYQHYQDAKLHLTVPGVEGESVIEGKLFDELTFIS